MSLIRRIKDKNEDMQWKLMPVILTTWETEIRRIQF
jgi:hypothetical protein